jgi:hypothetical protein
MRVLDVIYYSRTGRPTTERGVEIVVIFSKRDQEGWLALIDWFLSELGDFSFC